VFSGYVMRNLTSLAGTLDEVYRVLRPDGVFVTIDLGRPTNPLLRVLHRLGTAIVLPLVGLIFAGSPREYWYLHRSLDALPPPEILYQGYRLHVEELWRSGLFGFVYGARLRKE
jgi:ubiquinone/menaquinone biosynthesis C-methylase UbiE